MAIQEDSKNKVGAAMRGAAIRLALGFVAFVALTGLVAPFINASAFRDSIQKQLENSLGRKVEIGDVHFTLFTGPGFSLERVTIQEDARYGLEPFAYIPTLEARVRLDKLLAGQVRLQGLRLVEPSLNLVRKEDGSWNVVALIERLGAPRHTPLNFLPSFEVSNGRVDLKFGTRKAVLYITDTDLSIYPERSGKIYVKFEGSPARTDRAGNGFGHLRGTLNWYLTPASETANQLESDVILDQSNLSELTTLFQGQDLGVHGNISARVHISGPAADLRAAGEMRLQNVHRWDLIPAPGDDWRIPFQAAVDLHSHVLTLHTVHPNSSETAPAALLFRINDFMARPAWSVIATLHRAPIASVLPLARKMGLMLPLELQMEGLLDGVVGYSNTAGLQGGVEIANAVALLPNVPPLRSSNVSIKISSGLVHIEPAVLQASANGILRAGADYMLGAEQVTTSIGVENYPVADLKKTTAAWFGSPDAFSSLTDGTVNGDFTFVSRPGGDGETQKAEWLGQFQLANASLALPGVAGPLTHVQGRGAFDAATFELPHFSAVLGQQTLNGSYRYSLTAKHPERLRLDMPAADLADLEAALRPALTDDSLLSRLPFTRRTIPAWLANRDMEGDIAIHNFSIEGVPLGVLASHFTWAGTLLQMADLQLKMPSGEMSGWGAINLNAYAPQYRFTLGVEKFPWNGGSLSADGSFDSTGLDDKMLENLHASGSFSGKSISLPGIDSFSEIAGLFAFAVDNGNPALHLTKIQARQNDEAWLGEAATHADGKLYMDLTNGERQLHAVADLAPATAPIALLH